MVADLASTVKALAGPTGILVVQRESTVGGRAIWQNSGDRPAGGRTAGSRPAIILWTAYDYPQYAAFAYRAGAAGFVVKTAPTAELVEAIRRVAAGGSHFSSRPDLGTLPLSSREREVLERIVDGRSNDEIGGELGVATRTVEAHLTRLFERYDVRSRTELATRAIREGWLDVPSTAE